MELSKKMYYLRWLLLTEYIPSVPTLKTEYKLLLSVIRLDYNLRVHSDELARVRKMSLPFPQPLRKWALGLRFL